MYVDNTKRDRFRMVRDCPVFNEGIDFKIILFFKR